MERKKNEAKQIEGLIDGPQNANAPHLKVVIAGRDSELTEILFEPYSMRRETDRVVIEADLLPSEL